MVIVIHPLDLKPGDLINGRPVASIEPFRPLGFKTGKVTITYEDGSTVKVHWLLRLWVQREWK